MTGHDDFDRTLAGWFEAEATSPAPADGLDRVLDATRRRRPRPAWLAGPGSRWIGKAQRDGSRSGAGSLPRLDLRWSRALILLLALALVGGALVVGARLFQPSPLPTGRLGHLAYGLDGDIYVADWDGRNPVRIADGLSDPGGGGPAGCGTFWGEGPMWSPDGRHFAYRSAWDNSCRATTGEGKVFVSDPAGRVVASFPGVGWLVSWSPDSSRVATWVDLGKTIGIYGIDGVRVALVDMPTGYQMHGDYDPVWSPDGRSVLVSSLELPVDGGAPRGLLRNDPRSQGQFALSPDGARVAYITNDSLVVAAADGSQPRVLLPAGVTRGGRVPAWSPTSDRIAFDAGPASSGPAEIRVVDVASGAITSLASAPGTGSLDVIRFSPGGDRILFARLDANYAGTALWSVHSDGSDAQLLVAGTGWGDWQWQPADH